MDTADAKSPQLMVYEALQCVCSQNTSLLKSAEAKLAEWEIQPGFYTTLIRLAFSHQEVDTNVRWMATVYLKNGINKYWRKNAPHAVDVNEKTEIKRLLLAEAFLEPIPQIAIQTAVLIGNIARLDYPKDWNELMPRLNETINSTNQLEQHRALLILQQVVKALASKRLHHDRRAFQVLATDMFPYVLQIWNHYTQLFLQSHNENLTADVCVTYTEKALIAVRILRKLTIFGIQSPLAFEPCAMFINSIIPCLRNALEYRSQVQLRLANNNAWQQQLELTEKFILKLMKLLNDYLDSHTKSFVDLVPISLEFAFNYVFYTGTQMLLDNQNQITFPSFAINCINFMKNIAMKVSEEEQAPIKSSSKNDFFTVERLNYISEKIITYYFLLTPKDIELWNDDPEEYAFDESGESWKYDLRPCTESFYLTLFSQYRPDMTPDLVKFIQKAQQITLHDGSDLKDIFLKDAIYKAAGLSAFNLFDDINFDEWFSKQLIHEINLKGDNFRIIRRRAIWLIGQWTGVKFDRNLRPKVYDLCLQLLQPDEDMSVRLAAASALMNALGDFEFETSQFLDYLQPIFSSLFVLLKEAKECDTKMSILNIMSAIVDKMGDHIQPNAESLCQYLPLLWDESKDHNMLRCAILSTLLQLIIASSEVPPFVNPFLYPVIAMSTNKDEPTHIYFLEDGLELWLVVIQNSTSLTPELLQLSRNLIPLIEYTSENMRTCFSIIQAYILISPDLYLQQYGKDIVKTCMYLLSDLRNEGIVMIMRLFESMLRASPVQSIELLRPALPEIFKKVIRNDEYQMVMSSYLVIVARTLILDQMVFIQVLQELNLPNPLEAILDIWIRKMPLIGQPDKRKLLSLALASLLTAQNDLIYQRFEIILQCICETLNDIMKDDPDNHSKQIDSLILTDDTPLDTDGLWKMENFVYGTHHYDRCRELCLNDPVHTIVLKNYVESQINQLKSQLNAERFTALVSMVDDSIVNNLTEHSIILR